MRAPIIDIIEEPQGDTYQALVRLAVTCCDRFYLVWREQLKFGASAHGIAADLEPWLIRKERTDTWDGTKLLGHYADVTHYSLNPHSVQVLAQAERLYAWEGPDRPEDLTFYTSAGALRMLSVAHARFAYFDGRWVSPEQIRRLVPGAVLKASLSTKHGISFLDRPVPQ